MVGSKRCFKCGETKPVSEFRRNKSKKDGFSSDCKECHAAYCKSYGMGRPFYALLNTARKRAKDRDLPFSITEEYLESIWTGVCPVFQVRLDLPSHGGNALSPTKPSLDRLVPDKGYIPGNVIWISFRANTIKSDANSEEVQAVATWLQQTEEEIKRHEDTD
jgi:hypothetical protein